MPDTTSKAFTGKGTVFSIGTAPATTVVITANLTASSTAVASPSSTAGIIAGMLVSGTGITPGTTVATIGPIVLSAVATASGTAVTLTFVSPITYTAISELKTLAQSGAKNDTEDVTNFDSAGRAHEIVVTLLTSGEYAISGNYVASDAGQSAMRAAFASGGVLPYKIQLPLGPGQTSVGDAVTFNALVQEVNNDIQFDKVLTFAAKVTVTGVITYTTGS